MLWLAILLVFYGYLEARFIKVRRENVSLPGLPSGFDGLTVVHLSDLHLVSFGAREKRLCRILEEMESDLAVFTGDFKRRKGTPVRRVEEALRRITSCMRPRFGIVGIMGNKDSPEMVEAAERAGVEILSGRAKRVTNGKDALWIAGIDSMPFRRLARALISVTSAIPEKGFRILLSHGPDAARLAQALGYALILCGDTHGGQIRLPLVGPLDVKSQLSRRYCRGIIREGNSVLCVSSGIGTCAFPVRFLCPPEVTILKLVACGIARQNPERQPREPTAC